MQIYVGIFAMQLYWNHTSAWVISSKFAAFLQNTFSEELLWRAASGHLRYNKKHSFLFLVPLLSYNSSIPLLYKECHPYSLHSHPQFPASPPWFPSSHPDSPHSHPDSPHFHPYSPHSHPDFSHSHPDSPHSHPYSPHSYLIPRISIIPFISFPNSPFRLLQIAFINGFKEKEIFYFKKIRQLPGEFFSFFVSLFRLGEIKLWLSLTMQQFDDFWKLLENMHWSVCDGDYFW